MSCLLKHLFHLNVTHLVLGLFNIIYRYMIVEFQFVGLIGIQRESASGTEEIA